MNFKNYTKRFFSKNNSTSTRVKALNLAQAYYINGKGKNTHFRVTPNPKDLKYTYL
ncbi:hypothetical protein G8S55_08600 [Clostridium botulinum C]|uniref:hypothetical protein n=1 Tax=Clostridium TaxID=1485 RepID=UPI0013C48553|nr:MULTISPECIES: hypothetical protein [Clostridium]MCD3217307.1 hypothetical protein [Clostridium botulinum C]